MEKDRIDWENETKKLIDWAKKYLDKCIKMAEKEISYMNADWKARTLEALGKCATHLATRVHHDIKMAEALKEVEEKDERQD